MRKQKERRGTTFRRQMRSLIQSRRIVIIPFQDFSGAAIAYKLIEALERPWEEMKRILMT